MCGKIIDALVGAVTPQHQLIKSDLFRCSAVGFEAHLPRALYRRQHALSFCGEIERRRRRRLAKDDKDRLVWIQMEWHRCTAIGNTVGSTLHHAAVSVPDFGRLPIDAEGRI